jgi:hypothetical protein
LPPVSPKAARGPYIDKPFRAALLLAVKREGESKAKGKTKLDKIATALVDEAMEGDVPAAKEIADRLDGKVPQALIGGGENDPAIRTITEIRRSIVDA